MLSVLTWTLRPRQTIGISLLQLLSPPGRCHLCAATSSSSSLPPDSNHWSLKSHPQFGHQGGYTSILRRGCLNTLPERPMAGEGVRVPGAYKTRKETSPNAQINGQNRICINSLTHPVLALSLEQSALLETTFWPVWVKVCVHPSSH